MTEEWSLKTFSDFLDDQEWSKSFEYKNSCIPPILYKYYPLFDKHYCHNRRENKKRLMSLQGKYIWASNYKFLNDPFEFRTLFIDQERVRKYGWNPKELKDWLEFVANITQICCFSNIGINNMLLWAHYANNHEGYCIEYAVNDTTQIYPVEYTQKRHPSATLVTKFYSELKKYKMSKVPRNEYRKYLILLYLTFSSKSEHWRHENEFRFFNIEDDIDKGIPIPLTKANLNIEKIYTGIYCEHKPELIEIGKELGCEVYEMILDDYSQKFELQAIQVFPAPKQNPRPLHRH